MSQRLNAHYTLNLYMRHSFVFYILRLTGRNTKRRNVGKDLNYVSAPVSDQCGCGCVRIRFLTVRVYKQKEIHVQKGGCTNFI